MSLIRYVWLTIILPVLLTAVIQAQELSVSGQYRGEFEAIFQDSVYRHQHWINLVFEKDFGTSASMHLDLELNSYERQQITPVIREAYANYYTKHIDWRFGKQLVPWGSAYLLNPTSYFSPYDLTVINPGEKRMGVIAGLGRYYGPGRTEISVVFTPFFQDHKQSVYGQTEFLEHFQQSTIEKINAQIPFPGIRLVPDPNQPVVPASVPRTIENSQGGMKLTKRGVLGFDMSVSGYHGRDKFPVVNEPATESSFRVSPISGTVIDTTVSIHFSHPRVTRAGLDIIGSVGEVGVWVEGVQNFYRKEWMTDNVNLTAGFDYKFKNDLYIMGQGWYLGKRVEGEQDIQALILRATVPVWGFHELEVAGLYELKSESHLFQPQLNYSLGGAAELQIGGTLMEMQDSPYAPLISQLMGDRLYARLALDF